MYIKPLKTAAAALDTLLTGALRSSRMDISASPQLWALEGSVQFRLILDLNNSFFS